ncbi:hypothetical protein AA0111_g7790 [Alternaria arborescens]|uniref:hypothetical protein n=1 Tax=Alternaria arborescens TaxID=156630 RepID=UPI00107556EF|nr:hypothetical protein AA0111_g7790 [Alternaria arborescens]RYO26801.1 hypothetical protein AA0111_g7790 [Alternaria arborescens]
MLLMLVVQRDLFRWSATIFSSRSFASDLFTAARTSNATSPILYPVLDIFNHKLGAQVSWKFERGNFTLSLQTTVKQGQQIFNNYSAKGNEELLLGFGFCIPDNPHDRVAVRIGQVEPFVHTRLRKTLPDHWRSELWKSEESVFYISLKLHNGGEPSKAHDIPKLKCLEHIPAELTKSVYIIVDAYAENVVFENAFVKSKQVWANTVDVLLTTLERSLQEIHQWDSELTDCTMTSGAKAASVYREGQMKILQAVTSELRAFLTPLRTGAINILDLF